MCYKYTIYIHQQPVTITWLLFAIEMKNMLENNSKILINFFQVPSIGKPNRENLACVCLHKAKQKISLSLGKKNYQI